MTHATLLWSIWQALLRPFHSAFTRPGHRRFCEWITAMALNVEEHTITQSVLAIERPADWKAMETFAETGAWPIDAVARTLARLVGMAPGRLWYGYHVSAVDDTKVHRSGEYVWGTCTFHEYTARCPNRASTVRAHNWVVLGGLLDNPDQPAWFLPLSGRLYFRKSQLPAAVRVHGTEDGVSDQVRTGRRAAAGARLRREWEAPGRLRWRFRAEERRPAAGPARGRLPSHRVPDPVAPRCPVACPAAGAASCQSEVGQEARPTPPGRALVGVVAQGSAFIYGRRRKVRWKEVECLWRVAGHDVAVKVVAAKVEGYKKRFTLVTSAVELTGLQMVELFAARFRQEDGFRDLKQRLGWEECRAWTKNPIERTSQAQWVTMSLLRLAQFRLEAAGEVDWWFRPPWNRKKERPSVLDVERLLRRHRAEILQLLSGWLEDEGKVA